MKNELQPEQSVAIMAQMIAETRQNIGTGSIYYLVWGWATLASALSHYVLLSQGYVHHYLPWAILMPLAGVVTGVISYREGRKATVKTHLGTAMAYLWTGFLVMLLIALGSSIRFGWEVAYPFIIWLYGLGTFVSGGILRFRPLIAGGISAWVFGIVAIFLPFDQQLLALSAAIATSYILPGHLLSRFKK